MRVPRQILVYTEDGLFRKEDYPWVKWIRIHLKGGDEEPGYVILELYDYDPRAETDDT